MKKTNYDRKLVGPDSYEYFNNISKYCQDKYLLLLKLQMIFLSVIALLSVIPPVVEGIDSTIVLLISIFCILGVIFLMIIQYKQNYMEGWQNARFLAESIISNSWLLIFKIENYDMDFDNALSKFRGRIAEMKREINITPFLSITKAPNKDDDNPDWIKDNFNKDIKDKKELYLEYRINDQIAWYSNKSTFNKKQGELYFWFGLLCMFAGVILTILIFIKLIPNLSYLGFLTTIAATFFSWRQTKKFDELKTTYGVAANELGDFKNKISGNNSEVELKKIIFDAEKAISREHKLWFRTLG